MAMSCIPFLLRWCERGSLAGGFPRYYTSLNKGVFTAWDIRLLL